MKTTWEERFAKSPTRVWRGDKEVTIWLKKYVVEISTLPSGEIVEKKLYIEK